jgi:hypothetical protein
VLVSSHCHFSAWKLRLRIFFKESIKGKTNYLETYLQDVNAVLILKKKPTSMLYLTSIQKEHAKRKWLDLEGI